MPRPKFRSGSLRKMQIRTPGGKTKTVYEKRTPGMHKCAECGQELKGIPRLGATEAKHTPKTKKRPSRAYGGFLCAACVRKKLKKEARLKE
jgi:large subunit ribosomal protein L34e